MGGDNPAEKALILHRTRLSDPNFIFTHFSHSPHTNYSNLKFIISSSVNEACNSSVLLLGPRGCGKVAVLELDLDDLLKEYPHMITTIKLNGLLHSDDKCALKEIARQLCAGHQLSFSKVASFDDNNQFMIDILRECGLAHRTIIFVLDEFDLFAQGKQQLLYSLLDAMQSVSSQAVVVGISCRLDLATGKVLGNGKVVDGLYVMEGNSISPSTYQVSSKLNSAFETLYQWHRRLIKHMLLLPTDSSFPDDYTTKFNASLLKLLEDGRCKGVIDTLSTSDSTFNHLIRFLFIAVCFLTLENFKAAFSGVQRQPKLKCLKECSVLELYVLVCMMRLELREQESYNFNTKLKEYSSIHDSFQISDYFAPNVCLPAFEHLLQRGLISLVDSRDTLSQLNIIQSSY